MDDPERSDPKRSDWLSNVWSYIRSVERRLIELEERVGNLEFQPTKTKSGKIDVNSFPQRPLDED